MAGLLATTGNAEEALPLFARSHEIYVDHLGENHPHSVATQLWVQQLSAPPPPPRRARARPQQQQYRPAFDNNNSSNGPYQCRDAASHPPPLLEGNNGEEDEGSEHSPEHQPVCF